MNIISSLKTNVGKKEFKSNLTDLIFKNAKNKIIY